MSGEQSISVWAPQATDAQLEVMSPPAEKPTLRPMRSIDGGWFEAPAPAVGSRYRFHIDSKALPDPRSPSQPDGPMGWSEVIDHDSYEWSDHEWTGFPLASAVIYEIHVGTFTPDGTFDGVIRHLDDLVELGITAIELMPIATFPGQRGWGYDGVNLWATHWAYGGPNGLKRLIDACHQRRIAVIIDVVYNHVGPVGNSLGEFGAYFSDIHRSPWGDAVNLDGPGSDEVRRFLIDNALQWVRDFHADGLRLDAVHALHDESATHLLDELGEEVHAAGRRLGRTVWVIAESDLNDPRLVRSSEAYGFGLDAAWSDDFHHALHVALTGEQHGYYSDFDGLGDLAAALENVFVFGGRFAPSRARTHGSSVGDMDRSRFICYAQNHDQIGNRPAGDRLCHIVSTERAEIAAAIVLTAPFVPMLFQGEEWAASSPFLYFTDIDDPDVGEAIRRGRESEFATWGWNVADTHDPQDENTFRQSVLDWSERSSPIHKRVWQWHRDLIALRSQHVSLRDGRSSETSVQCDPQRGTIVVRRGDIRVVVNLGDDQLIPTPGVGSLLLTNDEHCALEPDAVRLRRDRVALVTA